MFRYSGLFLIVASVLLTGCDYVWRNDQFVPEVSYVQSNDGAIYFTTSRGELFRRDVDGACSLLLSQKGHLYTDVNISSDGKFLAVVEERRDRKIAPSILILKFGDDQSLTEVRRFVGNTPSFTHDNSRVLFARASRFVPQLGFGGNLWTDVAVWETEIDSGKELCVWDKTFFTLDRVVSAAEDNEIFVSGVENTGGSTLSENIHVYDKTNESSRTLDECNTGRVCSGDPAISSDSQHVVFVSDRKKDFHYWLYHLNVRTHQTELVSGSEDYRYIQGPSFSKTNDHAVLALATNDLTLDGRPKLALREFRENGVVTVIEHDVLSTGSSASD